MAKNRRLSREEERDAICRYQSGDERAADAVIESVLPWVHLIAHRYRATRISHDELVSEGCVGIYMALRKFDTSRELRFMSYATHWINQRIRAFVSVNRTIVSAPKNQMAYTHYQRAQKIRASLDSDMGVEDADRLVAEELEISVDRLRATERLYLKPDTSMEDLHTSFTTIEETLVSESDDPVELISRREVREALCKVPMDGREKVIVKRRLLGDPEIASLEELGDYFDISRERIRQIELRLKGKIRKVLEGKLPRPPHRR